MSCSSSGGNRKNTNKDLAIRQFGNLSHIYGGWALFVIKNSVDKFPVFTIVPCALLEKWQVFSSAAFTVDEVVVHQFYRRNYIEGLF
jgi:predicted DNA-binding helix-hairpin-helix protein